MTATVAVDRRRADRRSARGRVRLRERRSGFDRRVGPRSGGIRARYRDLVRRCATSSRSMAGLLAVLFAANAADLVLTMAALDRGAVELNPVMAGLFASGDAAAAVFKLGLVGAVGAAAWVMRRYRRVVEATLAVTGLLILVVAYQLVAPLAL